MVSFSSVGCHLTWITFHAFSGAPETYRPNSTFNNTHLYVPSAVNIWSLCTVWSEACIWVVYGMKGLNHYRQVRRDANKANPGFRAGNCFHDGYKLLEDVEKLHDMAQHDCRRSDFVTNEVWLELIKPNLTCRPDERFDAQNLWRLFVLILEKAEKHCLPERNIFRPKKMASEAPPEGQPGCRAKSYKSMMIGIMIFLRWLLGVRSILKCSLVVALNQTLLLFVA